MHWERASVCKKERSDRATLYHTGNFSFLPSTFSLPDRLVCYLSPSAVSNLSRDDALSLAQRITKNCPLNLTHREITRERAPFSLTTEELQVMSCPAVHLSSPFTYTKPVRLRIHVHACVHSWRSPCSSYCGIWLVSPNLKIPRGKAVHQ